ncbi:hypothetical protein PsorP6_014594 [Peronosclerospora sorghi]|uniref:Uncharacterized protein n=1 Tax=Peronosclerospora sorghi TaxID=230839 RepID=A0ACC0VUA0_9STRA|nr:hypothetical protein PsorP6_014594 [Peronosclerospora sorghi]
MMTKQLYTARFIEVASLEATIPTWPPAFHCTNLTRNRQRLTLDCVLSMSRQANAVVQLSFFM